MVLRIKPLLLCIIVASLYSYGCMTRGGYERVGVYDERHDLIFEHRSSFVDDGRVSMAYSIAYWDVIRDSETMEGRNPESFYLWIRNNTPQSLLIDPKNLYLQTENGEKIPVSQITADSPEPLEARSIEAGETISGYAIFEIPSKIMDTDKPSRLVYDDHSGNRAIRYLQIDDMKKYEGLELESKIYYYAPVYPRYYWYPYYYPYTYYPYDIQVYYYYRPYRRYYYYAPAEPRHRQFFTPSSPGNREFKGRTDDSNKRKRTF